jgi:hypothetical protein
MHTPTQPLSHDEFVLALVLGEKPRMNMNPWIITALSLSCVMSTINLIWIPHLLCTNDITTLIHDDDDHDHDHGREGELSTQLLSTDESEL